MFNTINLPKQKNTQHKKSLNKKSLNSNTQKQHFVNDDIFYFQAFLWRRLLEKRIQLYPPRGCELKCTFLQPSASPDSPLSPACFSPPRSQNISSGLTSFGLEKRPADEQLIPDKIQTAILESRLYLLQVRLRNKLEEGLQLTLS